MGRTPTRVLLHLALLYIFIPPVAGGDGGGLTANSSGSKGITCSAAVRPVDAVPIRSPQAVHSVLASEYFAGKHIVEIGTRNGDGISCFSKTAASSIAFEAKTPYCRKLEERQQVEHSRYTVRCTIFGGPDMGTMPDADVFTWWVGHAALDVQLLHELCWRLSCGQLRTNATAVVLFDHNDKGDMSSLRHLRHMGTVLHASRGCHSTRWSTVARCLGPIIPICSRSLRRSPLCATGPEATSPLRPSPLRGLRRFLFRNVNAVRGRQEAFTCNSSRDGSLAGTRLVEETSG